MADGDARTVAGVPLAAIQRRALEVLQALAGFCDAHGIRYYLVGGTLLGALRHRGFIPWDDDIDIVVPRPDYQRLLSLLGRLPSSLHAVHPTSDHDTPYPFLVVRHRKSHLVIDYARPFDRGVGVDVFPLDAVPASGWRRRWLFGCVRLLRALSMNKQGGYYPRPLPPASRLRFALLSAANRVLPAWALYRIYDGIVRRGEVDRSSLVGNLYGLYGAREVVDRDVFGDGSEVEFEGGRFRAPARPEAYLSAVYGDFRRLPPADRRHSGHRIRAVSIG